MPTIILPKLLVDGTDTALGSEVYANDKAIADVVNGGLASDNFSATANIKGSQLSDADPIPTSKIANDAVDATKLRDDTTTDANRAVTTNHIRDLAITRPKVSTTAGSRLAAAQLELLLWTGTLPATGRVGRVSSLTGDTTISTVWQVSVTPMNVGGNWKFRLVAEWFQLINGTTGAINFYDTTIDPNVITPGNIPVATYQIIGAWFQSPNDAGPGITGTLRFLYMPLV